MPAVHFTNMDGREDTRSPLFAVGTLENLADDELVDCARRGVQAAFAILVRRHQGPLLRTAARDLACSFRAADAVQETFIAVFLSLPTYEPRGFFRAYLFRILLSKCGMARRQAAAAPRRADMTDHEELSVDSQQEDYLTARERERALEKALARLRPKLRQVALLRITAGMSHQEIAEALTIPIGTARRRLCEALSQMTDWLKEAPL